MDHSTMSTHSMSSNSASASTPPTCKISMFWNWYTIDSCFISRSWHIRSTAMFAGSCIGVFLLVLILEFLRRTQREYDRYIVRLETSNISSVPFEGTLGYITPLSYNYRPTIFQQAIRAGIYMLQFGLAYFIMLLVMYYNGYFIVCMLLGAFSGHFLFGYENITIGGAHESETACC
ncbi:Ctr copper transporter family-domain-containing protein [Morchella snyderi]|nr:Ctr copper transporter family-domain-containing protein [Morchella snyderi]